MTRDEARQEIRNRIDGRRYLTKSKNGLYCCPKCGSGTGKNHSGALNYYEDTHTWTCFACKGKGEQNYSGDVIDLYMITTGTDYNTALHDLADELGITIDPYRATAADDFADRAPIRKEALEAPQSDASSAGEQTAAANDGTPQRDAQGLQGPIDYTGYYLRCAARLADPAAVSYLKARGISFETAAARYIGYDPEWVSPAAIRSQRAKGSDWTPPATARIIVPVTKNHYFARAIHDDKVAEGYRKQNETGNGGKAGIFNWKALDGDAETIFVTEAAFDALSFLEIGREAIALNSTSNADSLVKKLQGRKSTATFILCLDNDDAGQKATETLREGMDRLNISHITADVCCGHKDANEALVADRAAFTAAVQRAEMQTAAKPDSMGPYIDEAMQGEIDRLKAAGDIKTGFERLDEKSGGLYPGLYVIAATSSLGKTTFAGQIADNLAEAGHDVLFFSLEQSRLEIASKSFSRILTEVYDEQVSSLALRKGFYPDKLKKAAGYYKEHIAGQLSVIEGNFNCNITYISDYVRRYIKKNNRQPVVFVDYLQILHPAEKMRKASTKEAIDDTVTELKRLSRDLDVTVFVISSVNRANYLTPIDFESLKESGGIEYTADVIWGLQLFCLNEELFTKEGKMTEKRQRIRSAKTEIPREIQLVCLKNRYGIASYEAAFEYFPDRDFFRQAPIDEFAKALSKSQTPFGWDDEVEEQKEPRKRRGRKR